MPTVPRYNGRQVGRAPLPGVRVSPEAPRSAFLPAEAPDFSGVQRIVGQMVQEERQKADQIAVIDADAQLAETYTSLLSDPQTGVLRRRGKDALGSPEEVREAWDKRVSEIEQGLKTDRQRIAFRQRVAARTADMDARVQAHVGTEIERYDSERSEANIRNEGNVALLNYQDPARVDQAVEHIGAVLGDHAKRNGKSPEWLTDQKARATSEIRSGVVDLMLTARNDRGAKEYWTKHKAEIIGNDRVRLEKAVKDGSLEGEVYRQVDAIIKTPGITEATAFEQARKIEDADVRQGTTRELENEFQRRDRQERDDREKRFQAAADYAERGRRPPTPIWSQLTLQERSAVDSRIKQLASGGEAETNWEVYYAIQEAASTPDPKERKKFIDMNLLQFKHQLGDTEFKELVRVQSEIRTGKSSEATRGAMGDASIVNGTMRGLGLFPNAGKSGHSDAKNKAAFQRSVDIQIADYKGAHNGKIPSEETRRIVEAAAVQKLFVDRSGRDLEKLAVFVTEDERGRTYVTKDEIPQNKWVEIETRIRMNTGRRPKDRQVERAYAQYMLGDKAAALAIEQEGMR